MDGVSMLLLEVHIAKALSMGGDAPGDLRKLQDVFEFLFETLGFRFFYHHANQGWSAASPAMVPLGARKTHCCYEIGLYRELL